MRELSAKEILVVLAQQVLPQGVKRVGVWVCVCVCETLFTKGIRFYACFFVSFFFTQGAQGLVIQLGPTKLCMM